MYSQVAERYYTRRDTGCATGTTWGIVIDPDGKVRDRLQEREFFLDDVKAEMAFLNGLPPGRILDIGCGPGWMLSALEGPWEKYGVEVDRTAAELAARWAHIRIGPFEAVNYPDRFFGVVVMHHVIEHMACPEAVMQKVLRLLSPKGILLLGTPDFDSPCARRFGANYRLLHDQTHVSLFTNESMRRFLCDNGFVIDRVEYPFFETRHFTKENLMRLFDTSQVSPPFVGNYMTFYCHKP